MESQEEKLKAMLDWESAPQISQSEIDGLRSAAATANSAGRSPEDETYNPNYDSNLRRQWEGQSLLREQQQQRKRILNR